MKRAVRVHALALVIGACRPALEDDAATVTGPRLLAVRAEPAEARPNETTTVTAFYTDGAAVAQAPLAWSFCTERKALAEPDPVHPRCLDGSSASAAGVGPRVTALVPRDVCRTFGPDRPLGKAGEPAGRAADPDATGGFFLPGIVAGGRAAPLLFELRVRCALPSATQDVARAFEERYRANENPTIAAVARVHGDAVDAIAEGAELPARPGEVVHLRVSWPLCSDTSAPCGGAEPFVSYDPVARVLVDRREAMSVSWLATRGELPIARVARGEADPATFADDDWIAPSAPGSATLFVVLRDARGGVAFRSVTARVE